MDAKEYLLYLYEIKMLGDLEIEGLIQWLSTYDCKDFCNLYELGYEEKYDEED